MLTPRLPLPSSQPEPQTGGPPAIEQTIGELTAAAAGLVVAGLCEYWHHGRMDGRMRADTRRQGGELIALLIEVREATAGEIDFDQVAKSHGAKALRERNGTAVSAETIDVLINGVLHILHGVAKLRMN
jgi:hypothetical protein